MKAAVIADSGVEIRDVPKPAPAPNQVLVRVRAAGLNRADVIMASGRMHGSAGGPGAVLGLEFAGEVEAVGSEVKGVKPGDRVMCSGNGGYAEYAVSDWGRVLTIGSINQLRPAPDLAIYAALKAAQHNLCVNLARQYAPYNVMINNLSPGLVATERNRWRRADAESWRRFEAMAAGPIGRAAEPDEMVGAALLLCSQAASYIAGVDLMVTAGAHLPHS